MAHSSLGGNIGRVLVAVKRRETRLPRHLGQIVLGWVVEVESAAERAACR